MHGQIILILIGYVVVGVLAAVGGYLFKRYRAEPIIKAAEAEAERLAMEAQTAYKEKILAAKDEALQLHERAEKEINQRRQELQRQEQRLQNRREDVDNKREALERRSKKQDQLQSRLDQKQNDIDKLYGQQQEELQRVASLTREEAKEELLRKVEEETRQDSARVIREVEAQVKEEAENRAREIIVTAIQRCASDQVAESTVSSVPLPSDNMKGRIIGRGGRNIRAIENLTGVDLVVDDTPEAIIISSFDPVRREIARIALDKLILDGRIHPARIEGVVQKAQEEVDKVIIQEGENAVYELGIRGFPQELIRLIGRLKYRTSYGQNVLLHSIETAKLAAMIAADLKANVQVAKEAALLHDLGKAIDHDVDGPHAIIGADTAKKMGVSPIVVNAIAAHHGEAEPQSMEAIIVSAADAISGARPGARRESLERYIKRITALEDLAQSFSGVKQAYAIQAGREIRIIVKPDEVDDLAAIQLSKSVAGSVEEQLEYPGQIKVTVIRETRAVGYAK